MNTENLQTLKIHKLTQAQYDRELEAGNIDESALYLTPDEKIDLSPYATIEQVDAKADADHNHDDIYYTEAEIDTLLAGKSDVSHNHDSDYDEKGSASMAVDTHNASTSAHGDIRESIGSLQESVDSLQTEVDSNLTTLTGHTNNKSNPHGVTLSQLGVSATATELNTLDGITATVTELNYLDGVTSNVQTQIDTLNSTVTDKAPLSHAHPITASASDDDIVVLKGTKGYNGVTYSASHATSGVAAGTYKSITVDEYGHVTAGTNPTTLAEYGITDGVTTAELGQFGEMIAEKADSVHTHAISEVTNLQTQLDEKSDISHTHDEYMTKTDPVGSGSFSMNRLSDSIVGNYSSTLGNNCTASNSYSHAEGNTTTASGIASHAEGKETNATSGQAHAEGYQTTASGNSSHAEGQNTTSSAQGAHAEGGYTTAEGTCSHSEGMSTTASGEYSHAEGANTHASGICSHAEGDNTVALDYQHAQGHYNNTTNAKAGVQSGTGDGTAFVIGNGTSSAASNAFRVNYSGKPYAKSSFTTTGCDYAEFFEWKDLNPDGEDRRGYFVTLDEDKIKIAEPNDYIVGIISGQPSVIGNGDEDWLGRYVFDEFGAFVYEEFEYEVDELDKETGERITVIKTGKKYKENPEYDPTIPYIQREDRPEWDAVGMLGVLSVRDDGTCKVNGYCTVAEGGIATASETGYRVIKRVNDNIVKVIFR